MMKEKIKEGIQTNKKEMEEKIKEGIKTKKYKRNYEREDERSNKNKEILKE